MAYTRGVRGNVVDGSTFTYKYNAAGRLVGAESVAATVAYTYTASGLRVGQDTLARWDGASWTYHLPDALGSVRQEVAGAGWVTAAREWTPYGVEVEGAQAGLGYTGEWHDVSLGMVYLRARWYEPYLNQFVSPDPIVPNFHNPQSINQYTYALGDPINRADPSGLCAQSFGNTDCIRFVAEVEQIIEMAKEGRRNDCFVQAFTTDESLALDFLAWHYSGIPFSLGPFYAGPLPRRENLEGFPEMPEGTPRDRYRVPDWLDPDNPEDMPIHRWNHPIDYEDSAEGREMRATYGFKRLYYEQTHHYFGHLKVAYHYGGGFAQAWNIMGEINHMAHTREALMEHWGQVNYYEWYMWNYWESIRDVHLVAQAGENASAIHKDGIDVLPGILRTWCASDEEDVWSLEAETGEYYFSLPMQYWPQVVLAGWPEE